MRTKISLRSSLSPALGLLVSCVAWPILATTDSGQVISAKDSFRTYCASCHGEQARGDGPVAEHLTVPPSDLTGIRERHDGEFPVDRVFQIIDGRESVRGHGSSEMPVWGDAFLKTAEELSDDQVRQRITALVEYLESIQEP